MRCVLGFDGGGTKTDCVLMDESGRILARSRSGPSNPFRVGIEASSRALQDAAQHALSEARAERSSIAALCAGLAGTSRPELAGPMRSRDRKSTRLNSRHMSISYAVFCLKQKTNKTSMSLYVKKKNNKSL